MSEATFIDCTQTHTSNAVHFPRVAMTPIPHCVYDYWDSTGLYIRARILNCTGGVHPVRLLPGSLWGLDPSAGESHEVPHSGWSAPCTPAIEEVPSGGAFRHVRARYQLEMPPLEWLIGFDALSEALDDALLLIVSTISKEGFASMSADPSWLAGAQVGSPVLDATRSGCIGFDLVDFARPRA